MKKMKRYTALLLALLVCLGALTACGEKKTTPSDGDTDSDTLCVTDILGREVTVPADVERVACIGAGALRLYSYVGDMSKLCGVEECEYGFLISVRPYQMVNEALFQSLPSVGAGGPQGAPDAEALLSAQPDVIFSLYISDPAAMDQLQQQTGIPVVVLSYGESEVFNDTVLDSLRLMGSVLGRSDRAQEVCEYLENLRHDLGERTGDIPDSDKKTVYLGCQSNYGTHGIGSSTAHYALFDAVHAHNVLDENGYEGYAGDIDLESIVTMDPEVMILDAGGLSLLQEEYAEKKAVFDSLRAFQTGEVYVQMPYNAYYTNLEIAYADAFFIGTVLYPDRFNDVDPAAKFDEITRTLLGSPCYEAVADQLYGGYQKLDLSLLAG